MAFGPPPSRIFSSSFRTVATRSANARILDSKRSEPGSTLVGRTLLIVMDVESIRSRMRRLQSDLRNYLLYQRAADAGISPGSSENWERLSLQEPRRYNSAMLRKLASRPDWQIALMATVALRLFFFAMAIVFFPSLHPDRALIA